MPKIQLDIDRNIYPSQDPDFEYQANAKMLSAYFNNKKTGDLGIWICANPDPKYWKAVNPRKNTYAFFDVPEYATVVVTGNIITYNYSNLSITFKIGINKIRKTIVVHDFASLAFLSKYLKSNATLGKVSPTIIGPKHIELKDEGTVELRLKTRSIWDDAAIPTFRPCMGDESCHICNAVHNSKLEEYCTEHKEAFSCAGYGKEGKCPNPHRAGEEITYEHAKCATEAIVINNNVLELKVDWNWLQDPDRVFPIHINDNVECGYSAYTGHGYFDEDGGGVSKVPSDGAAEEDDMFDGNTATGLEGIFDHTVAEGTDYIDITLDNTYTIQLFKIYTGSIGCGDRTYKLLYKNNGGYSQFNPECVINVTEEPDLQNQWIASNDVSGQAKSVSQVRITQATSHSQQHSNVREIEVWGEVAAGGEEFEKSLGDTINLSDENLFNTGLNKADFISLSDEISKVAAFLRSLSDTIDLSDTRIGSYGLNKEDSVSLEDLITKTFGINKADTINLSDEISKVTAFLRSLGDTINLSDENILNTGLNKSDTINLSDEISKVTSFLRLLSDTINLSDNISKQISILIADSISLSDDLVSAVISIILKLNDTITLSDEISKVTSFLRSLSDTITLSDGITKSVAFSKADSIDLSDIRIVGYGLNKEDSISLADVIIKAPGLSIADIINLSDEKIVNIGLNKADAISLTDDISRAAVFLRSLSDTILLSDNMSRAAAFLRSLSDIILLSDYMSKDLIRFAVTPDGRIIIVPVESRAMVVKNENRTVIVSAENRVITIGT